MSVVANASGEGFKRTSGVVSAASDYTCAFHFYASDGTLSSFRTLFVFFDAAYENYVWIGLDELLNEIYIEAATDWGGGGEVLVTSANTAITHSTYNAVAYVRDGADHLLYLNSHLVATITVDLTAATNPLTEVWMGTDGVTTGTNLKFQNFREWDAILGRNEIVSEHLNEEVVRQGDLQTDTPLVSDLLDLTANNNDWTAVNAIAFQDDSAELPFTSISKKGWSRRASAGVQSGTTSVVVTKPTTTANGDDMFLFLSHKGAGYGVVPAEWELLDQEVSATAQVRGEVYWKRAYSEPSSYTVTGLATSADGAILSFSGGPQGGDASDVLDASFTRQNSGTNNGGVGAWTTSTAGDLVLVMNASSVAVNLGSANSAVPTLADVSQRDVSFTSFLTVLENESGLTSLHVGEKVAHNVTSRGAVTWSGSTMTTENVGILVAIKPGETSLFNKRYYFSFKRPNTRLTGLIAGDWQSTSLSPTATGIAEYPVSMLSPTKDDGGARTVDENTNSRAGAVMGGRWVTRPLATQTLSSYSVTLANLTLKTTTDNSVATAVVKSRLHIYLTDGDSLDVKTTLVDNYVDSTSWTTTGTYRTFSANFPGTVNIAEGDRIVVERGFDIVTLTGLPENTTYPPEHWVLTYQNSGTTDGIGGGVFSDAVSNPGGQDATNGTTTGDLIDWIEFSDTIEESATFPDPPDNDSCADAEEITEVPFKAENIDTSQSAHVNRGVWYKWTADADQRMIAHLLGTNYAAQIIIYDDDAHTCGTWTSSDEVEEVVGRTTNFGRSGGCLNVQVFDAEVGHTYYFFIREFASLINGSNAGGSLYFELCPWLEIEADDVIYPAAGQIVRLRDGQITAFQPDFTSSVLSGVAIDYTQRPLEDAYHPDDPGTLHEDYRLLVGVFGGTPLVEILDLETMNIGRAELDFIFDAFSGGRNVSTLEIDEEGTLYIGCFGNGFLLVAAILSSWEDSIPPTAATGRIRVIDATHGDAQSAAPWLAADSYAVDYEAGGADYVRLARDGTLLYSSSGQYVPVGGELVLNYDIESDTQLTAFATLPEGEGPNPGPKGICVLPDGGLLVCNGSVVQRLDQDGALVQTYEPSPAERATTLADVDLFSDNERFIVMNSDNANFFVFELESGDQLDEWTTYLGTGSSTSFVVFRPNRFEDLPDAPPNNPIPVSVGPVWELYAFSIKRRGEQTS